MARERPGGSVDWTVSGINIVRGQLVRIKDTVQTKPDADSSDAMKAARKLYPKAPELGVTLTKKEDQHGKSR